MTVSAIITLAQYLIGDTVSRSLLLSILDGRVKEAYDGVSGRHRVKFDDTTQRHPFLVTTAETYEYSYPSWAERILAVYDSSLADENSDSYPDYTATADNSQRKIIFAEDPGTTTETYKLLGIYNPTDMTAETDSLCIVPTNSRNPLLVVGAVSSIQPTKKGYTLDYWEALKADFRRKLRIGASPTPNTRRVKPEFFEGYGITPPDYRKRRL